MSGDPRIKGDRSVGGKPTVGMMTSSRQVTQTPGGGFLRSHQTLAIGTCVQIGKVNQTIVNYQKYVAKKRARNFMFACPEEEAMHSESLTQKRDKEQTRKSPSTHAKKMRSLHRKPMKYMRLQGTALSLRQHYVTCQREAQALQHMTKVGLRLERPRGTS